MEQDRPPWRTRRRFTKEFKADAASLVLDGGLTVAQAARDLGIGETNLGNWVRQARIDRGDKPGLTTAEHAELVRLRREDAKLRTGARAAQPAALENTPEAIKRNLRALWIFHNRQRRHPALGTLTPVEHQRRHATNPARDQAS